MTLDHTCKTLPKLSDDPLRSVRRTRRHAWVLAAVIGCVSLVVAGVIVNAMVSGLRGGAERMELMSLVPVSDTTALDMAPSRPAPSFVPAPTAAEIAAQEAALLAATEDAGPALGTAVVLTPSQDPSVTTELPANVPTFDGRPLRPVKTMRMLTTAYSPDERSCGAGASKAAGWTCCTPPTRRR